MGDKGFVAVPVMPVFKGMTKEFAERLEKPARESGQRAAKSISDGLGGAVQSLERQVKASESKLTQFSRASDAAYGKQEEKKQSLKAATVELQAAEEKYNKALKDGKTGTDELAKVERAKGKVLTATNDLSKAEGDAAAAAKKYKDQQQDLVDTTKKLEDAQKSAADEAGKSKKAFGDLGGMVSGLGDKASDMGGKFGGAADILASFKGGPAAGVFALVGAVGAASAAVGKFNDDLAESRVTMQNTMGLSADAARDMQGQVADALGSGLGDYEATAESVLAIQQSLADESAHMAGQTASSLSDNFMTFANTFQVGMSEAVSTVDIMLNTGLVKSAEEGVDLLTAGFQKVPQALQGEVLDATNEYSKFFANMGMDGSQAMAMLVKASEQGQYAIDKTGDAVKEFSLKAVDPAVAKTLGEMGIQVEDLAGRVARGGPEAGAAMREMAQSLLDIEDPGKRAEAAIVAFGTPLEDLAPDQIPKFLEGLAMGSEGMGDFAGASQTMADNTSRTFSGMVASWKGKVQGWAIDATLAVDEGFGNMVSAVQNSPLIDTVGSKFTAVKDTVASAWDEITAAFNGEEMGKVALVSLIGADQADWIIEKVSLIKDAWGDLVDSFFGFEGRHSALSSLIGADQAESLVNTFDDIGSRVLGFRDDVAEAFGGAQEFVAPLFDTIREFAESQMAAVLDSLGDALQAVGDAVWSVASALGGTLLTAGQAVFDVLLKLWDFLSPVLIPAFQVIAGIVGGVLATAFFTIVGVIRVAAEVIEGLATAGGWLIEHTLTPMIGAIGSLIQWFREGSIAAEILKSVFVGLGAMILVSMLPALTTLIAQWIVTGTQATIAGAKQVAAWVMTGAAAAVNSVASVGALARIVAGWVMAGAQSTIAAAKMAAAWVIGMGPVGWVIGAITAVVGALTWFFTQTEVGKEAWASFTGFLSSAWQTTVDALVAAWEWIRTTVIEAWNAYWTQVQENWALVTEALTAAWNWVKDLFIEGWTLIQELVINAWTAAWDGVRAGWDFFTGAIVGAWTAVKDGLVEAWNWIVEVVVAAWHREVEGMRVIWEFVTGALIGGWNWVRDTFVAVWNWIKGVVIDAWNREVDGMKRIFEFVTNAISGAWNWLKDTLHAGWTWINDNVFGALGRALDTVKGWFQSTVDNIGRIWDGIKDKTKAPVQFVVDVVYNNGIRRAWNAVSGLVGLKDLPEIKFASGGVLPGYTPGRDIYEFVEPRTGMRVGLSGGEAILRPEATQALGKDWVDHVNSAARRGGRGEVESTLKRSHFANGGIFDLGNFNMGGVNNMAGALSAIQRSHAEFVGRFFPGIFNLTSASRSEPGSFHDYSSAAATDWQNPATYASQMPSAESKALARAIYKNFPNSAELIHYPLDGWQNIDNGHPFDFGAATNAGHGNHVHWATTSPLRFDGDDIVLDSVPGGGGGAWYNPVTHVKSLWDKAIGAIGKWTGGNGSTFDQLPGSMLKTLADKAWSFIADKAKDMASFLTGGSGGQGAQRWRDLASQALRRMGYGDEFLDIMLQQIEIESNGDPNAVNDWDSNAAAGTPSGGLLQVIKPTFDSMYDMYPEAFAGLPRNHLDPMANLTAGVAWTKHAYGGPGNVWPTRGGYAEGGVVELPKLYDQGGWLPHGGTAVNRSGKPEPVFNDQQWGVLSRGLLQLGELVPVLKEHTDVAARQVAATEQWIAKAANPETEEGVAVRSMAAEFGNILGELGAEKIALVTSTLLESEQAIVDARAAHAQRLEAISDKEKALADAQSALKDAMGESEEASKELAKASEESAEKIKDAEDKLRKAKEDNAPESGDDEKTRKNKAEKIAEAEKDLGKVRKEQAEKSEESEKKRAETVEKANESVAKAEADLAKARLESIRSLDMPVHDLAPQLDDLASAGAKAAGEAGLGGLASTLAGVAALTGPAGISVGVAIEVAKQVIAIGKMIKELIEELIEKIYKARLAARKALADAFGAVADYAKLFVSMQENVAKLQQSLVRGMNEQRTAEFELRMAQQDRLVAEAEGALAVAQARLALDEEIRKAAVAAQIKLMGLHEDWDSYLSYQALVAGGVLEHWSDAAISALYTYEAARAKALQGELKARVDLINAEAKLAEATRQNARNQRDLLVAQERLIKMSAKVAGVDLVEATGGAQAAKLLVEMFENQQAMDKNVLGRWGYQMGADGSFANEYRGQLAQQQTLQKALDAVLAESGVSLDGLDRERLFRLMGETAYRGGDPMDVLRSQLPQLVEAETAIKVNDSLKPIYEAKDTLTESERQVEDLRAEIDLYEKVTPLEQTIKGLDYTIKGLEQSSEAWAKDNEDVRGDYLAAAKANADAAHAAGVDWKLDDKYATGDVRDRIVKEEHIHLDGEKMYTADQIDELLAKVTAGSNVNVVLHRSASDVADARRKESI